MCEQCLTKSESWGEVLPELYLHRARKDGWQWKTGEFGLVHCNDPDFVWAVEPEPDPLYGLTDEEQDTLPDNDPRWKASDEWFSKAELFERQLMQGMRKNGAPYLGYVYRLSLAADKAGYDREKHGSLSGWLFHRFGEWIRTHPILPDEHESDESGEAQGNE